MRVRALIQSTAVTEVTAEADNAEDARDLIVQQVPAGFDLIQVHNRMPRGGRVQATGLIRNAAVTDLVVDAPDYASAKAGVDAQLPPEHRVLSYQVL